MGNHVQEASTTPINTTSARNLDELQGPLAKDTGEHLLEHVEIVCIRSVLVKGRKNKDQELTHCRITEEKQTILKVKIYKVTFML